LEKLSLGSIGFYLIGDYSSHKGLPDPAFHLRPVQQAASFTFADLPRRTVENARALMIPGPRNSARRLAIRILKDTLREGELMAATTPPTLSRLVSRYEVAEDTTAFCFERPSNWAFKAGQCLDMTLIDPSETDAEGNTRTFSIASGPHEETLMVATRMRDTAFKRVLKTIPTGTAVKIEGPTGSLTLHNNVTRTAVFLAGGIGITPFRSIVFRAAEEKLPHRIILFYSNRRPEDAPFLYELQALEKKNPNYKLVASMTEMAKSRKPWHGEVGPIDREMLFRHLKDAISPVYYAAGPPEMVKGLHIVINEAGVDDDDIRAEEFAGY
jgi:ferredoxin-NADP reductase